MFKEGELHMQQYPVRTIDLEALRENVHLLRSTLPEKTKLMAVVKADAYGHGIAKVARAALEAGASALAVARTDEGAALRQAGVTAPVLVLGASSDEEIAEGVRNELTLTVCTPEMVDTLESCAKDSGLTGLMHLKIKTDGFHAGCYFNCFLFSSITASYTDLIFAAASFHLRLVTSSRPFEANMPDRAGYLISP